MTAPARPVAPTAAPAAAPSSARSARLSRIREWWRIVAGRVAAAPGHRATAAGDEEPCPPAVEAPPEKVEAAAVAARVERARRVRCWWTTGSDRPDAVVGLALSGGGIRSATFSLGLIQALARSPRGALGSIDVLSTVSGGSYIGTFLRSLFLPAAARGIAAALPFDHAEGAHVLPIDAVAAQADFAATVLASGPDQKNIGDSQRNPIWWLREHSRYLAPNGPTDYGYAAAYLSRNWVAMLYIFVVAVAAVMAVVMLGELLVWPHLPPAWVAQSWHMIAADPPPACPAAACAAAPPAAARMLPISPLLVLAAVPLVGSLVLSIAYWLSQAMSANEPNVPRQRRNLGVGVLSAALGGVVLIEIWRAIAARPAWRPPIAPMPLVLAAGLTVTALAIVAILVVALPDRDGTLLTAELRRRLTKLLAFSNLWLLILLCLAVLDSCGAGFAYWFRHHSPGTRWRIAGGLLAPVAAFLLKKLPEWAEGAGGSGLLARLGRLLPAIALVAGVLLYGCVAVATDAAVHYAAWADAAWVSPPQPSIFALTLGGVLVLAIVSGQATGFINLSSLHLLYATRLTRAYLGASNAARLRKAADPKPGGEITDNDDADYIRPALYGLTDLPAPIHVINMTVNETVDPQSQLVARDRKGGLLSVEPGGVRADRHAPATEADPADRRRHAMADTELTPWSAIGPGLKAEDISLGQWCAISGAAASSGMGRLTSLGYALALTFANVRLGYWWWSPGVCTDVPPPGRFYGALARHFGTFVYLGNELTARYSRGYQRKYLTDGGHFENSGAYALIRRRVPTIIVSDNGADPAYRFADLEDLVRTVRLDLGAEIAILGGAELDAFLARMRCTDRGLFVDPASRPDWRAGFGDTARRDAVLALSVTFAAEGTRRDRLDMVWIKPRQHDGMPQDLAGYAADNPDFPQQTTVNQFFGEAQWESYRKLGEIAMERLLACCPGLLADQPSSTAAT